MENNSNNPNINEQPQYQQPQYQQQPPYQQPPQYQPPQYQQPMYQQPVYQPPQVGIVANPCPRCGSEMTEKYAVWQILLSIILFPVGLVSLAAGKQKKCSRCGHKIS
ncbi:MAG: DUF2367 domain-containing protein [Clostridia bacterium]|nr:DUF2367 domain-containing protein [Clostridia bacterium]MBQ3462419.1 DUF2367 domain-containing protein [Clostridia bacterium]MBR0470436.1 DUF2367 domain-containing protein [Clostridia bacterium]